MSCTVEITFPNDFLSKQWLTILELDEKEKIKFFLHFKSNNNLMITCGQDNKKSNWSLKHHLPEFVDSFCNDWMNPKPKKLERKSSKIFEYHAQLKLEKERDKELEEQKKFEQLKESSVPTEKKNEKEPFFVNEDALNTLFREFGFVISFSSFFFFYHFFFFLVLICTNLTLFWRKKKIMSTKQSILF